MKIFSFALLFILWGLLLMAAFDLPARGPASAGHVESYYIKNTLRDAETPNVVTTILADYRGYDTLGETTVIFTAGIICFLLLRRVKE